MLAPTRRRMKGEEKQLLKNMYNFIEHLYTKVKAIDDLKKPSLADWTGKR